MVELILSRDFTTALCVEYCDDKSVSSSFEEFIKRKFPSILEVILNDFYTPGHLTIFLYFSTEEEAVQFKLTHGDTTWR